MYYAKVFLIQTASSERKRKSFYADLGHPAIPCEIWLSGVYDYEWALALFETSDQPDSDVRFRGFIDEHAEIADIDGRLPNISEGISMYGTPERRREKHAIKMALREATKRWEQFKATDGRMPESEYGVVEIGTLT